MLDINDSKDLLLAEYKYLCDSFRENEQIGERRIKFFITLVTAVLAACVTLITIDGGFINAEANYKKPIVVVIFFSLFFLLVVGFITLLRMIQRNRVTDGYKKDLDDIRQRFKDFFDAYYVLEDYAPFGTQIPRCLDNKNAKDVESSERNIKLRKFGGLTHTTAAMNSLILAVIVGAFLMNQGLGLVLTIIVTVFGISFSGQFLYIKIAAKKSKSSLHRNDYTHAGGIVYRQKNNRIQYLLITAKENRSHTVFPKGHIERGEEHRATAIREVLEESGILATAKRPVGSICFFLNKIDTDEIEFVRSKFYLMEYMEKLGGITEGRDLKWREYKEAKDLLSFNDSKELLVKANAILEIEYNLK